MEHNFSAILVNVINLERNNQVIQEKKFNYYPEYLELKTYFLFFLPTGSEKVKVAPLPSLLL